MPKLISVENVELGMVLKESIYNNAGMILLTDGTVISQSHINQLLKLKIEYIYVKTETDDQSFEFSEEILEEAKRDVLARMDWRPKNNIELDILRLGVKAIAHRIKVKGERSE